jgi:hypothetical protein
MENTPSDDPLIRHLYNELRSKLVVHEQLNLSHTRIEELLWDIASTYLRRLFRLALANVLPQGKIDFKICCQYGLDIHPDQVAVLYLRATPLQKGTLTVVVLHREGNTQTVASTNDTGGGGRRAPLLGVLNGEVTDGLNNFLNASR